MVVYIEQVILDNLIVNHILLYTTGKLLLKKYKMFRLILSNLLGTVCAVVFPLFNLTGILLLIVKILLGATMILVGYKINSLKQFFQLFFVFLFLTGLVGGLCFALLIGIYPTAQMTEGMMYYVGLPISILILIIFLSLKLVYDLVFVIKKRQEIKNNTCNIVLYNNNNILKIMAFIDTGNLLMRENKPVIVISYNIFKKLMKISSQDFLMGNYTAKNSVYINTQSPTGKDKMLIFEIDKIVLQSKQKQKIIDCYLGLSLADIENKFGCEALIGSAVLN